ncbi:MAG: prepilin-type N-terminal cleavage/methylation domain-containing protein [Vicinamibacterales bacterium]
MSTSRSTPRRSLASSAGFTLLELIVAMGIMTLVMAVTLGGLAQATKANASVMNLTSMNSSIRVGMDMLVRDMLQVGSGLPPSHVIQIPSGANATAVKLPGPPGTTLTLDAAATGISAVVPLPGAGPTINGTTTDVVVTLAVDNTFLNEPMSAMTSTTVDIAAGPNIATGPDRVTPGQLMMITKGTTTTLLQVTGVDTSTRRLTFATGDSLNLNQPSAAAGTLAALNAVAPANTPSAAFISRIRMITYYLDATTDAQHPRLVRRINNGNATTFDNTLGNAVALDIENLQFSYDLIDGNGNPANVRMVTADLTTSGRCAPNACGATQIRKINIAMTGRSQNGANTSSSVYRNTLTSEVSFRGMAFFNEYSAS